MLRLPMPLRLTGLESREDRGYVGSVAKAFGDRRRVVEGMGLRVWLAAWFDDRDFDVA